MLFQDLGPAGLDVITVSLDNTPEAAREWVDVAEPRPTYAVLLDTGHVVPERYGIVNIPTSVWIDEEGRVVKAPTVAPADDKYKSFTGIDSSVHHDSLRQWVLHGESPPVEGRSVTRDPDQALGLAERRLAAWLHQAGRPEAAERHFTRAAELAPHDWSVRRASMPLRGQDPFGADLMAFVAEWNAAGSPGHPTHSHQT